MSNFPLYDNLIMEKSNDDLTLKQKEEFVKITKNLDANGCELIYALIRTYQLENSEDKSTFKIPYGGKFVKDDVKFDLNDLPNELKNMLYKFVLIHEKTIHEEKILEKNRSGDILSVEEKTEVVAVSVKKPKKEKF